MDLTSALNIIGIVISFSALIVSIVSMVKSCKAEKLQSEVAELDAKLKALELADAEERRAACVEVRLIRVGKSRKLRFCNVGKGIAKNIDFDVLDESVSGLVLREHVPFPELEYQKSFDEPVIAVGGMPGVIDVRVKWVDEGGDHRSKVSHVSF